MEKLKLVIFDMDGVVFDTETLSFECYLETGIHYGFTMTPDRFFQLQGLVEADIVEKLVEWYGNREQILLWRTDMKQMRTDSINNARRVPRIQGIEALLLFLRTSALQICIASSNFREAIERYLEYEKLGHYFDFVVGKEDVARGKPDPEVFLKACDLAAVRPNQALVIEDSLAGLGAAKNAGIRALWLPNPTLSPKDIDYAIGDTFRNLEEIQRFIMHLIGEEGQEKE